MITEEDFARYDGSQKVLGVKDLTIGWERFAYLFETTGGRYVLKKAKKDKIMIANEVLAKKMLAGKTLPIAQTLYCDDNLIVENYIEGHCLTEDEPLSLYRELGECVREIHSIKTVGFGEMKEPGVGRYENEIDSIHECGDLTIPEIKLHPFLKTLSIPLMIENNASLLDNKNPVLIHGDLDFDNILGKDGKLAGIIDFGDAGSAPPERDLGLHYISFAKEEIWQSFLEGYKNSFNTKKAMFYAFLFGTYYVALNVIKVDTPLYAKYLNIVHALS
eukprot:TRINITY_DN11213_c0_g1_i6.p1 TRINITY_DN11213_c0_g1~~TRINITY_DN11213_c0_g1_i6.p1  ORF type:complete len:275 (-),score=80.51 TRINITY_DN11213_c0_g1_i6:107-931(-)